MSQSSREEGGLHLPGHLVSVVYSVSLRDTGNGIQMAGTQHICISLFLREAQTDSPAVGREQGREKTPLAEIRAHSTIRGRVRFALSSPWNKHEVLPQAWVSGIS